MKVKAKSVVLLGSLIFLTLTLVVIVFTLVTREKVTPTESQAATLSSSKTIDNVNAKSYKYIPLQETPGRLEIQAEDINEKGQVTGYELISGSPYSYYSLRIWDSNRKFMPISNKTVSAKENRGLKINESNQILGNFQNDQGVTVHYIYDFKENLYKILSGTQTNTKEKLILRPKQVSSTFNLDKSSGLNTIDSWTGVNDLNNQGQAVGVNNSAATLWIGGVNSTQQLVNLSSEIQSKTGRTNFWSTADKISNEVNGVVNILGRLQDNTTGIIEYFVLEYSIAKRQTSNVKILTAPTGMEYKLPRGVSDDGTILVDCRYYITGNKRVDDKCIFSKTDGYETKVYFSAIVEQNGIKNLFFSDYAYLSRSGIITMISGMPFINQFKTYIYNLNTKAFLDLTSLIANNQVTGINANSWQVFGIDSNSKGEILVEMFAINGPNHSVGVLTPTVKIK